MPKRLPVVAAIPNFNMGDYLRRLLNQIMPQHYDAVYVLDDASTDHSVDVVSEFGDGVKLVRSLENRGAGANRNQIIDHVRDGSLIHFIDADMELETSETPAIAREAVERYADGRVGAIGGLVSRVDGSQEPGNYGPVFSLWGTVTSNPLLIIDRLRGRPRLAGAIQRMVAPMMRDWPNVLQPPAPRPAYCLHEGNMLIHSSVFRTVGGYDPVLRSHEVQDLAIRLEKVGIKRQFDPSVRVIHHHIDVRGKDRIKWQNSAMVYLIRKHGLIRFLTDH